MGWREKGEPLDGSWSVGYSCPRLRHMRTTQERRLWEADFDRPARGPKRLINVRADRFRSDFGHRSWKRHRLTQFRPVEIVTHLD